VDYLILIPSADFINHLTYSPPYCEQQSSSKKLFLFCHFNPVYYTLYQVVEIHDVTPLKKRKIVEYRYHLLQVRSDGGDVTGSANINLDSVTDQSSVFLRAGHLVQIDPFLSTHGPCGRLFGMCHV